MKKDGKISVPSLYQNIVIDDIEGVYKNIKNDTLCDNDFNLKQIVVIQLSNNTKKYNNYNQPK